MKKELRSPKNQGTFRPAEYVRKAPLDEMIAEIGRASPESSIYVGTDSIRAGRDYTRFCRVVVLHFDSRHGARYWVDGWREYKKMGIREKLLKEVHYSVEMALQLVDAVGERNFEVHLDVNPDPKWESNIVHDEAMGYVSAHGLVPQGKPGGIAAYMVADWVLRHSSW